MKTLNYKDDLKTALMSLNMFMHNWCMNCEETDRTGSTVYNCRNCEFSVCNNRQCSVKRFINQHDYEFREGE